MIGRGDVIGSVVLQPIGEVGTSGKPRGFLQILLKFYKPRNLRTALSIS